jgi:hypothetical protein
MTERGTEIEELDPVALNHHSVWIVFFTDRELSLGMREKLMPDV